MDLIPKLTPRSLSNADKQNLLRQISGLACDATAAALNAGKDPLLALTILEQGRGVIAASLEDSRADLSSLQDDYPDLAREYLHLRDRLEPNVTQNTPLLNQVQSLSIQDQGRRFSSADQDLDALLRDIRTWPGYRNFLLPPDEEEICSAAEYGPIVVLNVSEYRCDALLVEKHQVRALPLPQLSRYDIEDNAQNGVIGSTEVLSWLWDTVAHPVLDELGFSEPRSDGCWPRVWWILTDVLGKFPMHAAGRHAEKKGETTLDRVMSSYNSSVRAIIRGRRHCTQRVETDLTDSVVLVAMQDTPGHSRLPHAAREISIVHQLCISAGYRSIKSEPRKKNIVEHLLHCKVFHFAGHGQTDEVDPSQSSLLLEDWEQDKLTVANLLEMNLRERGPLLAYLSACGTGEIKDDRYFDESIHLVSACQLAGFRHVIGTLWEVNDQTCVEMARVTYGVLKDEGMTDEVVCKALHMATKALRDSMLLAPGKRKRSRRVVGEVSRKKTRNGVQSDGGDRRDTRFPRKMVLDDSDEEDERLLLWVPDVHYGV
jgi:hypothetical protein